MAAESVGRGLTALVRRLTRQLMLVVAILAVANVGAIISHHALGRDTGYGLVRFFKLQEEASGGTWLAAILLAACAALALLGERTPRTRPWNWRLLAGACLAMSIDEVAMLHEELARLLDDAVGLSDAVAYAAWVPPLVVLAALFAWAQRDFARALPERTAQGLVVAGALFVLGAAGLEIVEALVLPADPRPTWPLDAVGLVQEVLELVAVTWALRTLALHVATLPRYAGSSEPLSSPRA